jgi:uncharacterized protein YodC (DUF2158 family)
MPDFNEGDAVRLKSGGRTMVVTSPPDHNVHGEVECAWFTEGECVRETYSPEQLERVEDEAS